MFAHVWLSAAALAAAPVPVDPEDRALDLYDKGAFLEAAEAAVVGYVSPAAPASKRLQRARLAQESFAKAYATSRATQARPEYLCRALDVLEATAPLALTTEDVRLHTVFAAKHRATLAEHHPGYVCETGTELRPILLVSHVRPVPAPASSQVPRADVAPAAVPANRSRTDPAASLTIAGAVSLSLGFAALAAVAGGIGLRSQVMKAARPLDALREQQGGYFTEAQARALAPLSAADDVGRQLVLAGGISAAVLLVVGAALVGRGHVLKARARVRPVAGPGHAGISIEGRF